MRKIKHALLVLLAAALLFPSVAHAAPAVGGRQPPMDLPGKDPGFGLTISWIEDPQGNRLRLAQRTVAERGGQRVDFWVIENTAELVALQSYLAAENQPGGLSPEGFRRLPRGGWVWWNSWIIQIYISHDLATAAAYGFGVSALISTLIAMIPHPLATASGGVMAVIFGLDALNVILFDDLGEPGFTIFIRTRPPIAWIRP